MTLPAGGDKNAAEQELRKAGDDLYDRVARPLEAEHWDEFIAILDRGEYVLGDTVLAVVERAVSVLRQGSHVFRIGDISPQSNGGRLSDQGAACS